MLGQGARKERHGSLTPLVRVRGVLFALTLTACSAREEPKPLEDQTALDRVRQITARQAEGRLDGRFHLATSGAALRAENALHGLSLAFTEQAAELASSARDWRL